MLIGAAVQQVEKTLFSYGYGRVDGHEREKVSAERIGQLPITPNMAFRGEEVDDACRKNDPEGEDNISEDVNVRCLHVDIIVEIGAFIKSGGLGRFSSRK